MGEPVTRVDFEIACLRCGFRPRSVTERPDGTRSAQVYLPRVGVMVEVAASGDDIARLEEAGVSVWGELWRRLRGGEAHMLMQMRREGAEA